jgi:dTDP-4-amino-4,6-dideoxygalactose transaminase
MTAPIRYPITQPVFGPEEAAAVQEPLRTGWVVQGPAVKEFEARFAGYIQAKHAVAASSCTTALHLALAALEVRGGNEVVVPAFTWVATANVVEYLGATPRFCDIDLGTFNARADQMADAISDRTVGLMPVHLFGLAAEMEPILDLGRSRGLWVVEDAACGFGSWYRGRHVGTFGTMGCFSFHPRKSITTGEGGMVVCDSDSLAESVRSLRDHGASRSDLDRHTNRDSFLLADYEVLGYNFRMTDLQGAIGRVQMDRADWILGERRRAAAHYLDVLAGREWIRPPFTPADSIHGYQSFVCLFAPLDPSMSNVERLNAARNDVMRRLEGAGIATRQGTHAAALQGFYAKRYGHKPRDFPNAYLAETLSMSLPLYPTLSNDDIELIVRDLDAAFAQVWH